MKNEIILYVKEKNGWGWSKLWIDNERIVGILNNISEILEVLLLYISFIKLFSRRYAYEKYKKTKAIHKDIANGITFFNICLQELL